MANKIEEPKWYPFLQESKGTRSKLGLKDHEVVEDCNIVIAKKAPNYAFARFKDIPTFIKYYKNLPNKERTHYEGINGNKPHKVFFDVDIDFKKEFKTTADLDAIAKSTLNELLTNIFKVFQNLDESVELTPDDLLLFSSHGKKKRSFHIVFKNLAVPNFKYNKHIHYEVTKMMKNREFIDKTIYCTFRLFRLWESSKLNEDRPKILMENWRYSGIEVESKRSFKDTLVSYTDRCKMLDFEIPVWESDDKFTKTEDFTEDELREIVGHLNKKIYEYRESKDRMVFFRRLQPSFCGSCKRIHNSENPYVAVSDFGEITLRCRRGGAPRRLGMLSTSMKDVEEFSKHIKPKKISKQDLRKFLV